MRGGWNERMHDGWGAQHIIGMVLMALFVVSIIWLIVTWTRKGLHTSASQAAAPLAAASPTKSAEEILAERLARGEIDPADYEARRALLDGPAPTA